ncbi:MAG TPA: alkyl sulfatase dimerization domain-containing protein [Methylomirabilota bacterium]|nr:alkyl sulfatase dimerization domain-containing protein [Methylomirabilota bacterium]
MGRIRELAEQSWAGLIEPYALWTPTGAIEEIADGVFFLHAFANVTVVRTGDGLLLIDSASEVARDRTFAAVRAVDPAPVRDAIYTHGHVDHAFGLPPFRAEAHEKGWPPPRVVAHANVVPRFDRYRATAGYNRLANARQFSRPPAWPGEYVYPDTTYERRLRVEAGGCALELEHARGETDDHTWIWWPEGRVLWTGDLFLWVAPNAGNPQKAQRYAAEWAVALRAMAARDAALLIPGHGMPILGADRVRQALTETAEWLEALVEQTLALMNAGAPLERILREVHPPARLADRPYLQPAYDEPQYVVRNLWRLYGGWYDGAPAHLQPAPAAELGAEVATLAGGVAMLVARARRLADEGRLALASHLIDWAVATAPDDRAAHAARAEIYGRRAARARALMTRGIFTAAARESAERAGPGAASGAGGAG